MFASFSSIASSSWPAFNRETSARWKKIAECPEGEQEKVGNTVLGEAVRRAVEAGFPEARIETKLKIDSIDPAQDILAEAGSGQYQGVALGRRGRSRLEQLLLGSVSGKVAEYGRHHPVWIVDCPLRQTGRVLVAMENERESRELAEYAAEILAPVPRLRFTFLHLMPPVPPTFWDDGHILESGEMKDRQARIDKWRSDWIRNVEAFMEDARGRLVKRGVADAKIDSLIVPVREGVARDLLNEIDAHEFQVVVMGKKSFRERKALPHGQPRQQGPSQCGRSDALPRRFMRYPAGSGGG